MDGGDNVVESYMRLNTDRTKEDREAYEVVKMRKGVVTSRNAV